MRLSTIGVLVICALVPSAKGGERFSADAVALFAELTQAYDLNGRRMPAGKFGPAALARLAKSKEAEVALVAKQAPHLKLLQELSRAQNKKVLEVFGKQAKEWPGIMAGHVIEALASPEGEKGDIRWAAKLLEDLMGTEPDRPGEQTPQQAVNRAWAIACMGNGLGISMRVTMRKIAARGGTGTGGLKGPITVTVETGPGLGAITLTNRSGKALHHCLIFTRLEADAERIKAAAAQEDLVGAFLLPALGFSKKLVDGSREAARLRHLFNRQDKGVMVYVPEIPAGGKVSTLLARPDYYLVSRGASMSIWCDELAVDPQPAENWAEARLAVERATGRTVPIKGRPGTPGGERRSAPNPGGRDLFYKGAIWRGAEVQIGGRAEPIEIEILSRDGDTFRADMRWRGRHGRYIEGTVKDGALSWRGAKGEPRPGVPHTGKITGKRVEGEFTTTVRGREQRLTFRLEYVPPRD